LRLLYNGRTINMKENERQTGQPTIRPNVL